MGGRLQWLRVVVVLRRGRQVSDRLMVSLVVLGGWAGLQEGWSLGLLVLARLQGDVRLDFLTLSTKWNGIWLEVGNFLACWQQIVCSLKRRVDYGRLSRIFVLLRCPVLVTLQTSWAWGRTEWLCCYLQSSFVTLTVARFNLQDRGDFWSWFDAAWRFGLREGRLRSCDCVLESGHLRKLSVCTLSLFHWLELLCTLHGCFSSKWRKRWTEDLLLLLN